MIVQWVSPSEGRYVGRYRLRVGGVPGVLPLLERRAVVLTVLAAGRGVHDQDDAHAVLFGELHDCVNLRTCITSNFQRRYQSVQGFKPVAQHIL